MCLAKRRYVQLLAQLQHEKEVEASKVLISAFRAFVQRRKYLRTREATIKIQSLVRMTLAKKVVDRLREEKRRNRAASILQAFFKMIVARAEYRRILAEIEHQKRTKAAVVIQSAWKCHKERTKYLNYLQDLTKVQSIIRAFLARKRLEELKKLEAERIFALRTKSAIIIQSFWHNCWPATSYWTNLGA